MLTHHARDPLPMAGGTTFHFVTDGIEAALTRAKQAAGDKNVEIAGGGATINANLQAVAIDELQLHVVPVVLGQGLRLFDGVSADAEKITRVSARSRTRCGSRVW
jgi:dihydrofolate reductase